MTLTQALGLRTLLGRIGALCCFLALAAVLDGIITKFREPFNVFAVLPGETVEINGPTAQQVQGPQDLEWVSSSPDLGLKVDKVHPGYFLGGRMWQGRLLVGQGIAPGKYAVAMRPKGLDPKQAQEALVFRVTVYPDAASRQRAALSAVRRYLGLSPFLAAFFLLPGMLLAIGGTFLLSRRVEKLMAAQGQGEIYRVTRGEGILEVSFGLGTEHGVHPGDRLPVFDHQGRRTGMVEVREASPTDAEGVVAADQEVKAGYLVSLTRSESDRGR
jgi:hypothetical protein